MKLYAPDIAPMQYGVVDYDGIGVDENPQQSNAVNVVVFDKLFVEKYFATLEDAWQSYVDYGREVGFTVRKRSTSKGFSRSMKITEATFVCSREGRHKKQQDKRDYDVRQESLVENSNSSKKCNVEENPTVHLSSSTPAAIIIFSHTRRRTQPWPPDGDDDHTTAVAADAPSATHPTTVDPPTIDAPTHQRRIPHQQPTRMPIADWPNPPSSTTQPSSLAHRRQSSSTDLQFESEGDKKAKVKLCPATMELKEVASSAPPPAFDGVGGESATRAGQRVRQGPGLEFDRDLDSYRELGSATASRRRARQLVVDGHVVVVVLGG
ncbi:hypothetical protein Dimus_016154 [Dionaea muscipula]